MGEFGVEPVQLGEREVDVLGVEANDEFEPLARFVAHEDICHLIPSNVANLEYEPTYAQPVAACCDDLVQPHSGEDPGHRLVLEDCGDEFIAICWWLRDDPSPVDANEAWGEEVRSFLGGRTLTVAEEFAHLAIELDCAVGRLIVHGTTVVVVGLGPIGDA